MLENTCFMNMRNLDYLFPLSLDQLFIRDICKHKLSPHQTFPTNILFKLVNMRHHALIMKPLGSELNHLFELEITTNYDPNKQAKTSPRGRKNIH